MNRWFNNFGLGAKYGNGYVMYYHISAVKGRKRQKMQEVVSETLLDSIPKDGLFDMLLHYGLLLGALFQLVCIFAVVFVPTSEEERVS